MTITITRHDAGTSGEYHAAIAGSSTIGRLTYVRRHSDQGDLLVAEHTLVPAEIGGRGVAGKLVEALIADARAEHFRIEPACSYVEAAFRKHPEWASLRT